MASTPSAQDEDDDDALVPQLDHAGITESQLNTAVKVLNAVAALNKKKNKRSSQDDRDDTTDGLALYQQPNLRPLRKSLAACLELHKRTMFNGKDEEAFYQERLDLRRLKRQKMAEQAQHQKYLADTELRRGRVERLRALQEQGRPDEEAEAVETAVNLMIPDGHVETTTTATANGDGALAVTTGESTTTTETTDAGPTQLPKLRSCYVCKIRYRELHHFYDQLCPPCAALNWTKRHQTCDLQGRVAVVTGSRVKIGFQTCLKLLRAGCTVIATTRFPHAAVAAYRRERDFDAWASRLHVYGLDLRDVTGLEAFTRFVKTKYSSQGIDVLINNACQTVRRPRAYYLPMVQQEQELWNKADDVHKSILGGCAEFERIRRQLLLDDKQQQASNVMPQLQGESSSTNGGLLAMDCSNESDVNASAVAVSSSKADTNDESQVPFETTGLSHSAAMSQMIILPEDVGVSDSILPPGLTDINGQQLDLRTSNSWLLKMDQVSTPEVMECMFINAIAPFVLNSRLQPLMTTPEDRPDRYIINVSAMEGKFYRYKMPTHPHTNMGKAALNMLTRTSAEELAKKHRIYMNSVDTGWINDENPLEKASKIAENNLFQTPIDEIDAAARILDPIFTGVKGEDNSSKVYGKFLKDYRESEW